MAKGREHSVFQRNDHKVAIAKSVLFALAGVVLFYGGIFVAQRRWNNPSIAVSGGTPTLLAAVNAARTMMRLPAVATPRDTLVVAVDDPSAADACRDLPPPIWPRSFVVTQKKVPHPDSRVAPATTVTYYDSEQGANLIRSLPDDGGDETWDLELTTGESFYFTPSRKKCRRIHFPVGILRNDWLAGATPLGPKLSTWRKDGEDRLVCGWTKLDFIDYYVDAETGVPDSWYFHTMKASFRVLDYYITASIHGSNHDGGENEHPAIDPALFVPPDYCFEGTGKVVYEEDA